MLSYVTVSDKMGHSAQNVLSSYKQLKRSTRANFRQEYLEKLWYLSFLPAQEWERYALYAGRHALSKMRKK